MKFLKAIFKRPVTVCIITVVCMALGFFATGQMKTNLLPDIAYPALGVTIPYPGASAETCDEDVRPLMENSLKTLSGVKSITTQCVEHASVALVLFDYGTDIDKKINEIKDKFALVQFPSSCYDAIYTKVDFNGMAVATVAVCNPDDPQSNYEAASKLKDKLLAIENVGSVNVVGVPEDEILITPINGLEITSALIIQTLMTNDQLDLPLGTLEQNGESVAYRNESSAETIEEISATPIEIPLPEGLYSSLVTAKAAFDFVQNTSSAQMIQTRDELKKYYDTILNIQTSSGQDVLDELEGIVPFDDIHKTLTDLGYTEIADAVLKLRDFLKENPEILNPASEAIIAAQREIKERFPESYWEKYDAVIAFKQSREYYNDITGETVQDELLPSDYIELLNAIELELPLKASSDLIAFIMKTELPADAAADADGNVKLFVRVSDIAKVTTKTEFPSKSYYNGSPSVTLQVYGISGANTTAISEAVKKEVESSTDLEASIILLDDQAQFINDSISNVVSSMLIGGVLAIIVIFLFLKKVRTSLIIGVTMPFSVLCTLVCLYAMGLTLNMVTLGGLAVGIGMLVDNSIVLIESITFERERGKPTFEAAADGTRSVAGSLLASTLTSICVFFPILFTTGLTEMIFADMSWSVIFSISFSLIVALTVIPTLYCLVYGDKLMLTGKLLEAYGRKKAAIEARKLEKAKKAPQNAQNRVGLGERSMIAYEKILRGALRFRWPVLIVAVVIFAGSMALAFATGTEFLPSVDQRTIEVRISFAASDKLDYCEEQTLDVYNDLLASIPDVQSLSVSVGKNGLTATSVSGIIRVLLNKKAKDTTAVLEDVRAVTDKYELETTVTEVDGVLAALMSGIGGLSNISVSIAGDDVETLKLIAKDVRAAAYAEHGYFKNITDNLTDEALEYRITLDKMLCLQNGIDYTAAVATLRVGIAGHTACTAQIGENTVDVTVRFADGAITDYYEGIENLVLGANGSEPITLGDVATITPTYVRTVIKKENGKEIMTLSVETAGIDNGTAATEFNRIVEGVLKNYDGYEFQESGVNYYLSEVFDGLTISIIVSFLLLFAVMACQFESLKKPFIVIFAIPFSFTGGFLGLVLTGTTLNVVSFVGLIMLMGVAVNDAIVLIDHVAQFEKEGLSGTEAIIAGAKSRWRAIWMTTLTTVLALFPLALAIGDGAELMKPLAIVVIGGLTLCTVVTLVLIPVMYSIVNGRKKKNAARSDAEDAEKEATVTAEPNL